MVPIVLCCTGIVPQSETHGWRLPVAQEWKLPSGAAGAVATPPTSSAASAAMLEDITDAVEMDSVLVANDAKVLTSAEIMYNPFDRPSDEEVVEAIPRDRSRSHSRSPDRHL